MEILALGVLLCALFAILTVFAVVALVVKLVLWPIQFVVRLLILPILGLGFGVVMLVMFGVGLLLLLGGAFALLFLVGLPFLLVFGLVWLAARLTSRPASV